MGLLNTWGPANRVISNDKVVTYSSQIIFSSWSYQYDGETRYFYEAWEYHRYCSKQYSYVGMDRETAQSCAEDMIQKYTRAYTYPKQLGFDFEDRQAGEKTMADITIQQREGTMYDVIINVHEDDVKMRTGAPVAHIPALFTAENQRDYDDDDDEMNGEQTNG